MITTILTAIAKNVFLGWLWRRAQEIASWAAGLVPLYMALPPAYQELILGILQGRGGGYSISVYGGFAYYLWTQWQSYRATVAPQAVTHKGEKILLTPAGAKEVEAIARLAPVPRKRTLVDRIMGR